MKENITSNIPRPEYPRPHFVRKGEWVSLNGPWAFRFDDADEGVLEGWKDGLNFDKKIIVPFPYQSELSGINDKKIHPVVWYSRTIDVPEAWRKHKDILLNFGAVDYRTTVWINGREVGHNQGGHVPFSFDISPYVQTGENRITVRVVDSQNPEQPRGKQSVSGIPASIDYYCTTGIWQSVWLEVAPQMRFEEVQITPLVEKSAFRVTAYLHAPSVGWNVHAEVLDDDGKAVAACKVEFANSSPEFDIVVPDAKLWSPETPNLYMIRLSLSKHKDEKGHYDTVEVYSGMRSVLLRDGKFWLNGKPYFLKMILDQGYWPDGILTAPTDEALKRDIEMTKEMGFNGSRKHQKIEDPRWLYWADKLGLVVWGEMANAREWSLRAEESLMSEWQRAVRRDYNHPSIVTWVPINESWGFNHLHEGHPGEYAFLERMVAETRRLDRYRPVIDNDGWDHTDTTDIASIHDYTQTSAAMRERYKETLESGTPPHMTWAGINLFTRGSKFRGQPIILTEVGGFLMIPPDSTPQERDDLYNHYGSFTTAEDLFDKYKDIMEGIASLPFVAGFCYTQLTDIHPEINGLLTADRAFKIPVEKIREVHEKLFKQK